MAREPHAGPVGLGELLAASGVALHDDPAESGGTCPRCHQPVHVDLDADAWYCGCGLKFVTPDGIGAVFGPDGTIQYFGRMTP